jgi:hypothetical protein
MTQDELNTAAMIGLANALEAFASGEVGGYLAEEIAKQTFLEVARTHDLRRGKEPPFTEEQFDAAHAYALQQLVLLVTGVRARAEGKEN